MGLRRRGPFSLEELSGWAGGRPGRGGTLDYGALQRLCRLLVQSRGGGGALSGGARVREHVRVRARSSTAAHLESQPVKTYEVRTCLFSSALRGRDVDSRVFSTV